jgi:hypothetical protein
MTSLSDIVLNTNAFRLFFDSEILEKIIANRDHIYVATCSWEKEGKGVYASLFQTLYTSARKLRDRFHVRNVREIVLPDNLKDELQNDGASNCDIQIASLAYDRRERSGQNVWLLSSDSHLQRPRVLFERHGIRVEHLSDFVSEY